MKGILPQVLDFQALLLESEHSAPQPFSFALFFPFSLKWVFWGETSPCRKDSPVFLRKHRQKGVSGSGFINSQNSLPFPKAESSEKTERKFSLCYLLFLFFIFHFIVSLNETACVLALKCIVGVGLVKVSLQRGLAQERLHQTHLTLLNSNPTNHHIYSLCENIFIHHIHHKYGDMPIRVFFCVFLEHT